MFADFNTATLKWTRKGIPWLDGSSPSAQRAWKLHVKRVLRVNRYFNAEGRKILLRHLSVVFTHCVGLGSGLRFIDHIRWYVASFVCG
jgi:hypothetical protein